MEGITFDNVSISYNFLGIDWDSTSPNAHLDYQGQSKTSAYFCKFEDNSFTWTDLPKIYTSLSIKKITGNVLVPTES